MVCRFTGSSSSILRFVLEGGIQQVVVFFAMKKLSIHRSRGEIGHRLALEGASNTCAGVSPSGGVASASSSNLALRCRVVGQVVGMLNSVAVRSWARKATQIASQLQRQLSRALMLNSMC